MTAARWRWLGAGAAAAAALLAVHLTLNVAAPEAPQTPGEEKQTPGAAGKTPPPQEGAPPDPARARVAEPLPGGMSLLPEAPGLVALLNDPRETPEHDLEVVENLLSVYRQIFGDNPSGGLNREIVAALLGRNARRLAIIPPGTAALNSEGELLDRWGTPFHFHPVSAEVMEVMSAGPDKALWTDDDVGRIKPAGAMIPTGF